MSSSVLKWSLGTLGIIGVVVASALLFQQFFLPPIVEIRLQKQLESLGLNEPALDVLSISWSRAELRNLAFEKGTTVNLGTVSVGYSPSLLTSRRVSTIEIRDARIAVKIPENFSVDKTLIGTSNLEVPPLPFDQLSCRSCTLAVELNGKQLQFPFSGTLTESRSGVSELIVDLSFADTTLHLTVRGTTGTGNIAIAARAKGLPLATVLGLLPLKQFQIPLAGGQIDLELSYERSSTDHAVSVSFASDEFAALHDTPPRHWRAKDVTAIFTATLGPDFALRGWDIEISSQSLEIASEELRNTRLSFGKRGNEFSYRLSTSGQDWQVEELSGTCPRLPRFSKGRLQSLASQFRINVSATRPRIAIDYLRRLGVDATAMGSVRLQGSGTFRAEGKPAALDWAVHAPALALQLQPGNLHFSEQNISLHTFSGQATLRVAATPERLQFDLISGSVITIADLDVKTDWGRIGGRFRSVPSIVLTVGDEACSFNRIRRGSQYAFETSLPDLRADLLFRQLIVPGSGVTLGRIAAKLRFAGKWTSDEVKIKLRHGSMVSVQSGTVALAGGNFVLPANADPGLALVFADSGALIFQDPSRYQLNLGFEATVNRELAVTLADGTKTLLRNTKTSGSLSLAPGGLTVDLKSAAELGESKIQRNVGGGQLAGHLSPGHLEICLAYQSAQTGSRTSGEIGFVAEADDERTGDLHISLPEYGQLNVTQPSITGSFLSNSGSPAAFTAEIAFRDGTAEIPAAGIRLEGLSGTVPISIGSAADRTADNPENSPASAAGEIRARRITFRGHAFGGFVGKLSIRDKRFETSVEWRPWENTIIQANGKLQWGPGDRNSTIQFEVPEFELANVTRLFHLLGLPSDMKSGGRLAAHGRAELSGKHITPSATIDIRDGRLESRQYLASISGIDASITFDSLAPPRTLGGQRITIRDVAIGKLVLQDGVIEFRLESPESLFIEQTAWRWAGGRLRTHAVRFNPRLSAYDFVVFGEGLQLNHILDKLPLIDASGAGTLYGRLPVSVKWPQLRFGDGFLYSTPEVGNFQIGEAAVIGNLLEQNDPRFIHEPTRKLIKENLVSALQDFEYTVLRADFIHDNGRSLARVFFSGKGRRGKDTQEIGGMTINIPNFDSVLETGILVKQDLDGFLNNLQ